MQASPSTVTGPWDDEGSGTASGRGAAAPLAAQGFQLPSATLQELRPAMSMHSETTSPR